MDQGIPRNRFRITPHGEVALLLAEAKRLWGPRKKIHSMDPVQFRRYTQIISVELPDARRRRDLYDASRQELAGVSQSA